MNYRKTFLAAVMAIIAFLTAGLALAHEVTIGRQAKLGEGAELQAGTYRLELVKNQDATEAAFYQGKDLVMQVPVKLVTEAKKCQQTQVHFEATEDGWVINQILVAGWKERLVFREPQPAPETDE